WAAVPCWIWVYTPFIWPKTSLALSKAFRPKSKLSARKFRWMITLLCLSTLVKKAPAWERLRSAGQVLLALQELISPVITEASAYLLAAVARLSAVRFLRMAPRLLLKKKSKMIKAGITGLSRWNSGCVICATKRRSPNCRDG